MNNQSLEESISPFPSASNQREKTLGLALSGGGSRAIAFHLGCFRALDDLGYLDKIDHISSVSGGSLFSALYCYYDEPFSSTDERVTKLLRDGLESKAWIKLLFSTSLLRILGTKLLAGTSANLGRIFGFSAPFQRWYSRTNLFIEVLEKELYPGLSLNSPTKNDIDVIINACELSTGS
ncbi:MAG TPA: hypothetical protein DD671_03110, partial [Balneolaceae bacterium]|nr:hypothetical protein [Balneolaceae bacterium]